MPDPERRGPERSDVDARAIVAAGVGLLVVAIVIHAALWLQVRIMAAGSTAPASAPVRALPPEPRLQTAPAQDLASLRAAEDAVLGTYGWVDRQAGVVRIPIERAKALLAGKSP
jgi:hypothetical protein